jgi:hypothetical protein
VNRSTPLAMDEYLGVHADKSDGVGIVVSGNSGSEPYVGFGVNGQVEAEIAYDGAMKSLQVSNNNSLAFSVDDNGEMSFFEPVNATQSIVSTDYEYSTPKTRYLTLGTNSFYAQEPVTLLSFLRVYAEDFGDEDAVLYARVDLPQGAVITKLKARLVDEIPGGWDVEVNLSRTLYEPINGFPDDVFLIPIGYVSTSGVFEGVVEFEDTTLLNQVVDNSISSYHLTLSSTISTWPAAIYEGNFGLQSVQTEYIVYEAD